MSFTEAYCTVINKATSFCAPKIGRKLTTLVPDTSKKDTCGAAQFDAVKCFFFTFIFLLKMAQRQIGSHSPYHSLSPSYFFNFILSNSCQLSRIADLIWFQLFQRTCILHYIKNMCNKHAWIWLILRRAARWNLIWSEYLFW